MNFIAIIGIVDKLLKSANHDITTLKVKVEKPFIETSDEDWFDIVNVSLNKHIFKKEINMLSKGSIIGIKGRVKYIDHRMLLIGERIQVF